MADSRRPSKTVPATKRRPSGRHARVETVAPPRGDPRVDEDPKAPSWAARAKPNLAVRDPAAAHQAAVLQQRVRLLEDEIAQLKIVARSGELQEYAKMEARLSQKDEMIRILNERLSRAEAELWKDDDTPPTTKRPATSSSTARLRQISDERDQALAKAAVLERAAADAEQRAASASRRLAALQAMVGIALDQVGMAADRLTQTLRAGAATLPPPDTGLDQSDE